MFKGLSLHDWRQFQKVEIDFHPRVTIIAGANGSGKTTLLNLLAAHFGWNVPFVSTPRKEEERGLLEYMSDLWRSLRGKQDTAKGDTANVGEISYSTGKVAQLLVPTKVDQTYTVTIKSQQTVPGLHIPSHRPVCFYQPVENIPTSVRSAEEVFQRYSAQYKTRSLGVHTQYLPSYHLKEGLISLGVFGYGNPAVLANDEARLAFEGFGAVLRKMLPPKLGFKSFSVRIPEVVMETESGDFSLDAVSGGVAAVIDLGWQVFMYTHTKESAVVTIDEPENHLHPEMQRSILPNLVEGFPNVQFIISTHNPFIVGSLQDSHVYVLDFNDESKVVSRKLDLLNKAGTSNDILREALGLSVTMPIWVEKELDDLITAYASKELTPNDLQEFRRSLAKLGMDTLVPQTIATLIDRKSKQ